ncbi:MAG: GHKL domain-containing protein [Rubrivivax sp.]|nr:GHKL domain-containing protein [Rubrivivax sp.]
MPAPLVPLLPRACHRRRLRAAAALGLVPVASATAVAADPAAAVATPSLPSLVVILLVAAVLAGGAWLLGRHAARRELRQAREALRRAEHWQRAWRWQTGADDRLQRWQGPGQPAAATAALFPGGAAPQALQARLQAREAFTGLRQRVAQPLAGSRGWELQGEPCFDDSGAFAGFVGLARPTDDDDARRLAAAALAPALAACAGAALTVRADDGGWQVQALNERAAARWPGLRAGDGAARLDGLPPAVADALATGEAPGGPIEAGGWRLAPVAVDDGVAQGLLLVQTTVAAGAAAAAGGDGAEGPEGEAFSFTVSHDLRAPIRVVEGFTRIVKEDYGRLLDRVGNDHLDRVLGAAARMNLMIDALMTLARLSSQPLARQPVNLSQLAGYVVEDLRRSAPERSAEVEIEPGLAVTGDPTLLRLVLENLLGNAWKYSARAARAQISLRCQQEGTRRVFVVRDNGAGFDMRSADRLFGLFQRLHSASEFPGHGVGLASVRRIVRRHGGEIWAEAEPGRGAAFFFTLAP